MNEYMNRNDLYSTDTIPERIDLKIILKQINFTPENNAFLVHYRKGKTLNRLKVCRHRTVGGNTLVN
ncbi:hypothetical protein BLOT_010835 [Blomia tropicalis]|nr:hypothetical protein BLOT_010835 [Blomia tropicalis]